MPFIQRKATINLLRLVLSISPTTYIFAAELLEHPLSSSDLHAQFKAPPIAYRPMVRWFWPGGDVDDRELQREIAMLDDAKFGGAEIQPLSVGLNPQMSEEIRSRVNDYLTPSFFAHIRTTLDVARRRGMWLDFTFGSAWPFGGGEAITPELASLELRFTHRSVRGPTKLRTMLERPKPEPNMGQFARERYGAAKYPEGWQQRIDQRQKVVAVVAVRGQQALLIPEMNGVPDGPVSKSAWLDKDSSVVLTGNVSPEGMLEWDVPPGDWQIFTFAQLLTDLDMRAGAVGEGPQLVIDHLKRTAFEAHAHRVGDATQAQVGSFFGNTLRAIFCDSLEVPAYLPWTDNLLDEFKRRRGYDLTPFLPILKVPGFAYPYFSFNSPPIYDMSDGERVRYDYWQTVSDMMIENFFQPFSDWASTHNLLSRVQAHGAPADVLRAYGTASIPETETLYDYGRFDFLKMASSAANLYGKKVVSSESFDWLGDENYVTPQMIKRHADELFTAGVNQIIYHGFPYEYGGDPGWYPFEQYATLRLNSHYPFWPYLASINEYIARIQYLLQQSSAVVPIAIYRDRRQYDWTKQWIPEPEINTLLMREGYSFDHINTDALLRGRVANRQLVSPGGTHYKVLVFKDERKIPLELAQKLAQFIAQGLPVLFIGEMPAEDPGYENYKNKAEAIKALTNKFRDSESVRFAGSVDDVMEKLRPLAQPNVRFLGNGSVPFIQKRVGPIDIYFLRNTSATEPHVVEAEFMEKYTPQIWDPWTGDLRPAQRFIKTARGRRATLTLPPSGSLLLIFDPKFTTDPDISLSNGTGREIATLKIGDSGWKFHGNGSGPKGEMIIPEIGFSTLIDWANHSLLRDFSGKGVYSTRFTASRDWLTSDKKMILSLGEVRDVAEIKINGHLMKPLLLPPYEADITQWVRAGENLLEVGVVNTLTNALLSRRAQASKDESAAIAPLEEGLASAEARSPAAISSSQRARSGLIGPVILSIKEISSR